MLVYFLTFNTYKYAFPLFPFYSFDNDDMKSSKRHAFLLSLIFLLKCFSKSFFTIKFSQRKKVTFFQAREVRIRFSEGRGTTNKIAIFNSSRLFKTKLISDRLYSKSKLERRRRLCADFLGGKKTRSQILRREIFGHLK